MTREVSAVKELNMMRIPEVHEIQDILVGQTGKVDESLFIQKTTYSLDKMTLDDNEQYNNER